MGIVSPPPTKNPFQTRKEQKRMKRKLFEKVIYKAGFNFKEHGSNHDTWKRGTETIQVPRHKEVNDKLARLIFKSHAIKIDCNKDKKGGEK